MNYNKDGTLLEYKNEARKLRIKVTAYILFKVKLYRRSFSGLPLKCVHMDEVENILCELHEDHYGSHSGGWLLTP